MSDTNNTVWVNFWQMAEDIRAHVKNKIGKVVSCDDPVAGLIGYQCESTGKTWSISVTDATSSLETEPNTQKRDAVSSCLNSDAGKSALLSFFNST